MSIPPLPAINVTALTIDDLNLQRINVDYVTFEKLDTHGYFMNIYILLWTLFIFVMIQTTVITYLCYRYVKYNRYQLANSNLYKFTNDDTI